MQIISLEIENVKKIRAAHIVPTDNVIQIQGDNAAGKSSVLDAITMALKGGKEIPEIPIREGADKGGITMEFEDFTVIRNFTPKGSTLKIESKEGGNISSPQTFLDKLVGRISFDPLQFINQDDTKQRKVLMELIGVDVDALDKKEKEVYDERTLKGRELKAQEVVTKEINYWPEIRETEEIKISDMAKKLEEAIEHNQDIANREAANEKLKETAIKDRDRIKELQEEIDRLTVSLETKRVEYKAEKQKISELVVIDTHEINEEIRGFEEKNQKIRDNINAKDAREKLVIVKEEYDEIDNRLTTIREEREQSLKSANIPVPGLTFGSSGLLYNSVPLAQCSDGEKLMVSMGISMALNPTMRVLRIKDGSLLGTKNLKILSDLVKDKGYQLWLEKVADRDQYENGGKVGIYIEEGEVVAMGQGVEEVKSKSKSTTKSKSSKSVKPEEPRKYVSSVEDDDF